MMSRSRVLMAFSTPISRRRSRTAAKRALAMPRAAIARATTSMPDNTISTTWRLSSTAVMTLPWG